MQNRESLIDTEQDDSSGNGGWRGGGLEKTVRGLMDMDNSMEIARGGIE